MLSVESWTFAAGNPAQIPQHTSTTKPFPKRHIPFAPLPACPGLTKGLPNGTVQA